MAASTNSSTPFFGCKISLISKSEIRYEGILYTIDPKESTIALAKVRSFGSEDRPVERPVPPRDDIFEFIIFRASDIKDLIVDDPPPAPQLADPAIIQAHSTSTSFPSSFPQGSINQSNAVPSGPAPVSAGSGGGQSSKPIIPQLQPASVQQQQSKGQHQAKLQQQQQQSSGGDSHNTDGVNSKQQPKQSTASNVAGAPGYSKVLAGISSAQSQQPKQQQQSSNQRQQQQQIQLSYKQQGPRSDREQQQRGDRSALMMGGGGGGGNQNGGYVNRRQQTQNQLNRETFGDTRTDREQRNSNYHVRNGGAAQHPGQGGSFRPFNQQRTGGFVPRGGLHQGGGFRRGGYNNAGQRQFGQRSGPHGLANQHHRDGPNAPKFAPLPEGEFDFEKAESDFKILEEKLQALKLNGAGGDSGADTTDVIIPGIPLSAISVEALEKEEINVEEPCYNKTKSFFDSISCEALEREKGTNQRVDWKAERKVNRETFGVVSARRPTFFRVGNRGGGGYQAHRGGYQAHRSGGYQNRNWNGQRSQGPGDRNGPRTPSGVNNVSSTTNGGQQQQQSQRTPAKSPSASNVPGGASSSPAAAPAVLTAAAIVAKN